MCKRDVIAFVEQLASKEIVLVRWNRDIVYKNTFCLLGIARACILFLPFHPVSKGLGKENLILMRERSEHHMVNVKLSIARASRHIPWTSNCLAQSLAAAWMHGRRQISSSTYLCVKRE